MKKICEGSRIRKVYSKGREKIKRDSNQEYQKTTPTKEPKLGIVVH